MGETTSPPDGDYLGYGDYADTLWARVLAALNKDAAATKSGDVSKLLGDDPLVVGIFGEWGAGKSRLLQLIQRKAEAVAHERITAHKADSGMDLTVPVFFQPWKYEHESHLLVPLLLHILADLNRYLALSQGLDAKTKQAMNKAGDQLVVAMPAIVSGVEKLWQGVKASLSLADPTGAAAALAVAGALATHLGKDKKPAKKNAKDFDYQDNGRAFYEIHDILKHITRPQRHAYTHPDYKIDHDIRINFVIFIDDLDRCLPEKAVETLDLIKTIFNAESFAFVLALDEEVVERGIGHRYKDYALAGKKPEMPITGFEYLEKIVHLPFRLPALTRQQALDFMQRYEKGLLEERVKALPFYAYNRNSQRSQWIAQRTWLGAATTVKPCLAHLVVSSFDAFVPRKLIRIVELLHQVLDVLDKRGRIDKLQVNGTIDPRLLMAFLLLQLFHPDLYRTFRRTRVGFEEVLDAFNDETLNQITSDLDLWRWAAIGYDKQLLAKQESLPPESYEKAVLMIGGIEAKARYKAQQIYLPIAQRLVEHRAAQRHVFDPLRLFASLKASDIRSATFSERYSREYYSLLTQDGASALDLMDLDIMPTPAVADDAGGKPRSHAATDAGMHTAPAHMGGASQTEIPTAPTEPANGPAEHSKTPAPRPVRAGDAETLFNALVSTAQREQQSAPTNVGLKPGERLDASSASELHQRLKKWLASVSDQQRPEAKRRLLRGLQYLAPHIARDDSETFWDLVKDVAHGGELGATLYDTDQLHTRVLSADVRSALGADERFDSTNLYLPKTRHTDHDAAIEPIAGFVRIPGGAEKDYFVARYLTTVDQYACFVNADDFNAEKWWRNTQDEYKAAPKEWQQQLAWGSRPVCRVQWFGARAYARWLSVQLRSTLDAAGLHGYQVRLPTEMQWERAARAASLTTADKREWPWGGNEKSAHLNANINQSKIGHASTVGVFPANPVGLYDLAGNLWEWQNNEYDAKAKLIHTPIADLAVPKSPALRGGSWSNTANYARCSSRYWIDPDDWLDYLGVWAAERFPIRLNAGRASR